MLQCFVDTPRVLEAIARCGHPWIVVLSERAMWAQIDWYPRLIKICQSGTLDLIVPKTNAPAPSWQCNATPSGLDVLTHRAYAATLKGPALDVTNVEEPAAPVAAAMLRENAPDFLEFGLAGAHESARRYGTVGIARSVYAIHF